MRLCKQDFIEQFIKNKKQKQQHLFILQRLQNESYN